jgi:DNA-binding HxlR family transcriptional regulator
MPPRVEYRLTDKGHALLGVVESMRDFGMTWLSDNDGGELTIKRT